jgi:hypothetical protein
MDEAMVAWRRLNRIFTTHHGMYQTLPLLHRRTSECGRLEW